MRRPKSLAWCLVCIAVATVMHPLFGVVMLALLLYVTRAARMDGKRRLHYDQRQADAVRAAIAVANRPVIAKPEALRDVA